MGLAARLAGVAGLACLAAGQPAAQDIPITVTAAWNGHAAAGAMSEIAITVTGAVARILRLELPAAGTGDLPRSIDITLAPDRPSFVWLPVRPAADGNVRIALDGADRRFDGVFEPPTANRPVAWVAAARTAATPATGAGLAPPVIAGPAAMPRTPQGYDTIAALVLDAAAVPRLDEGQTAALRAYLAGCGRTVVVGFPPPALTRIDAVAGCGGDRLAAVSTDPTGATADTALRRLLAMPEPPAPPLPETAAPAHPATTGLAAFAALYAVLAVAVGVFARVWWHLMPAPIVAAALAWWVWTGQPPAGETRLWAVAQPPAETGRYQAALRLDGMSLNTVRLTLPAGARLESWPAGSAVHHRAGRAELIVPTRLYGRDTIRFSGVVDRPAGTGVAGQPVDVAPAALGLALPDLPSRLRLTLTEPGDRGP